MSNRSFFRRHDSQPRTPPRPSTSPAASTPYSPFRRQPLGRSEDLLPSTPESPSIGPATPNAPNGLNNNIRSLSRTWSVGTIPIVFDTSSPCPSAWNSGQQQPLGASTTDSPTFPSGVGSVSDSPGANSSPQALGYPSSPADNSASPLKDQAAAPSSPSPIARKRRWKGRFDQIGEAESATRSPETSEDSGEGEVEPTQGAIVGLGVEAPGVDALGSPIVPSGSPHKTYLPSRFRTRKRSTSLSPHASPDPSCLHPADKLRPPRHSRYDHDDDDATSIFSLSAYYAVPNPDSPSFNDYEERFGQQHLHVRQSPALGPAISFDAFPRLTSSLKIDPETDPFSANGARHVREASGRTARPLDVTQPGPDESLATHVTTPSINSLAMGLGDSLSEEKDTTGLESAPLSAFSETTESSRSYSSLSASSISTRPTEIVPSSSCESSSENPSPGVVDSCPPRTPSIIRSSSDAPPVQPPLQGRFRSSSVIVPPSPVTTDFQHDKTRHLPPSSSLGAITSTPRTYKYDQSQPTPLPLHVVTPETPITFARPSEVVTPSFSLLPNTVGEDRRFSSSSKRSALNPRQLDSTDLCSYPYGGGRTGQGGNYDDAGDDLEEQQKESERRVSSSASGMGSQRMSYPNDSTPSLASSSFVDVNLPTKIAFLKGTIVELHIDQEGFRAIKPTFRLYRHTYNTAKPSYGREYALSLEAMDPPFITTTASSSLMTRQSRSGSRSSSAVNPSTPASCFEDDLYGEYGLVEFRMSYRGLFVYHHAKFDSPPTLRRVTINGDESKDYVSREASLSLKENGVYAVQGWEDKGKLYWKMEYLVDDRKAANGIDINGEKTIMPLTFSCSPFLLDPERGKKIGMFQVVKKSLTPKISSSRLRPPQVTVSPKRSRSSAAVDDGPKNALEPAPPPAPPVSVSLQTHSHLLSRGPGQVSENVAAQEALAKSRGGVRSAFAKVLSRPSTPGRPSTPKRPRTPNKRPSTASKAIVISEPSPAGDLADPFAKLAPSNFTAADWAKRAANATLNRPRAASVNAKPLLPSRPLDLDLNSLPSLARPTNAGPLINTPDAAGSLSVGGASQGSPRPSLLAPHLPGPIVPRQQIERWMSDAQKDRSTLPPPRPRTANSSNRPPPLPKRPSTATTAGRPWNKI